MSAVEKPGTEAQAPSQGGTSNATTSLPFAISVQFPQRDFPQQRNQKVNVVIVNVQISQISPPKAV